MWFISIIAFIAGVRSQCVSGQLRCGLEEAKCCHYTQMCHLGECEDMTDTDTLCDEGEILCELTSGELECCGGGKTCSGPQGECVDNPEAEESTNAPESSDAPDASDSPETSDTPDGSESPEASDAPDASDTPDASDSPETSDTPDASDSPEASDTPDASDSPEASETPDASDSPEASETPDASDSPEASETPDASDSPEASETPDASDSPEASDTPDASDSPEASETPDASDSPEASDTPDASDSPEASDTPDASDSPEASDTPDSSDAPGTDAETGSTEASTESEAENPGDSTEGAEASDTPESTDSPSEADGSQIESPEGEAQGVDSETSESTTGGKISAMIKVSGITEANMQAACDAFAASLGGIATYCSMTPPSGLRRLLQEDSLYVEVEVPDIESAATAIVGDGFISTVDMPDGVDASTVTVGDIQENPEPTEEPLEPTESESGNESTDGPTEGEGTETPDGESGESSETETSAEPTEPPCDSGETPCGGECCEAGKSCTNDNGELKCVEQYSGVSLCEDSDGHVTTCQAGFMCNAGQCVRPVVFGSCPSGTRYCARQPFGPFKSQEYQCCSPGMTCVYGVCKEGAAGGQCQIGHTVCGSSCCYASSQCIAGKCQERLGVNKRCDTGQFGCRTPHGDYTCCDASSDQCVNGHCDSSRGPRLGTAVVRCAEQVRETCYGSAEGEDPGVSEPGMVCALAPSGLCVTALIEEQEGSASCANWPRAQCGTNKASEDCRWMNGACKFIDVLKKGTESTGSRSTSSHNRNFYMLIGFAVVGFVLGLGSFLCCRRKIEIGGGRFESFVLDDLDSNRADTPYII